MCRILKPSYFAKQVCCTIKCTIRVVSVLIGCSKEFAIALTKPSIEGSRSDFLCLPETEKHRCLLRMLFMIYGNSSKSNAVIVVWLCWLWFLTIYRGCGRRVGFGIWPVGATFSQKRGLALALKRSIPLTV